MHVGASCGCNYPLHRDLLFQIRSSLLHLKRSNVSKIERPSDKQPHSRCVSCPFTCAIFHRLFTTRAPLCHGLNEAVTACSSSHLCKLRGRRKGFVPVTMPRFLHLTAHKGCHPQMKMCFYSNHHAGNTEGPNPFDMIHSGALLM